MLSRRSQWLILLLSASLAGVAHSQSLSLQLVAQPVSPALGGGYAYSVSILNHGRKPVTLVLPGDGSSDKMRTPYIGWSVLPADHPELRHPAEPLPRPGLRCGNMNAVLNREIFQLKPDHSRELDQWLDLPAFAQPGRYRVVFYYRNVPDAPLGGVGDHNSEAIKRMRESDPCTLISNEVIVEVPARDITRRPST